MDQTTEAGVQVAGLWAEAETYALGNLYLFAGKNIRMRKTKK